MLSTHHIEQNATSTQGIPPHSWLWGYVVVLCALAMVLPTIVLPAEYHHFADQIAWGFVPHARDVLSNLAFLFAGIGLWVALRRRTVPIKTYSAWYITAVGLMLTCLTSGVYHVNPNHAGLAFDRIGMIVAFSGVVGILLEDCMPNARVLPAMAYGLLLGLVGIFADYWHGNMTPWAVYQAGILGLLVLVPVVHARLYTGNAPRWNIAWWQIVLVYVLAKVVEMADHALWEVSAHILSGHNLKHLIAAVAVVPLLCVVRKLK